jgi:hypothetical protein
MRLVSAMSASVWHERSAHDERGSRHQAKINSASIGLVKRRTHP